ncbi:MAG: TetR/AcrR family transcriptional regulator, partial [Polyangiaceae bacterium]|nr:TetR/AcrR family transcriptional regulator [Polyangiaceae bacterium]
RRDANAEATRASILAAAREAFAQKGYAATSLEDIVGPSGFTKGALYHHFGSKQAVLEAVYTEMESELVDSVQAAALEAGDDPWERTLAALDAFFESSAEPAYVRVVLRDSPSVLGSRESRAIDHALGLELVESLIRAIWGDARHPSLTTNTTARIVLAAASEVAISMADSDDPERARAEGRAVVVAMLAGLRAL